MMKNDGLILNYHSIGSCVKPPHLLYFAYDVIVGLSHVIVTSLVDMSKSVNKLLHCGHGESIVIVDIKLLAHYSMCLIMHWRQLPCSHLWLRPVPEIWTRGFVVICRISSYSPYCMAICMGSCLLIHISVEIY